MVVGVALSPFGGTLAAAELSPALGLFLPVQREVEGLYSDPCSWSSLQVPSSSEHPSSSYVTLAGTKETMSKAESPGARDAGTACAWCDALCCWCQQTPAHRFCCTCACFVKHPTTVCFEASLN